MILERGAIEDVLKKNTITTGNGICRVPKIHGEGEKHMENTFPCVTVSKDSAGADFLRSVLSRIHGERKKRRWLFGRR
jgi:hypothetical protein